MEIRKKNPEVSKIFVLHIHTYVHVYAQGITINTLVLFP